MIDKALEANILRYHFVEQWGVNTIARQLGIHHTTVDRVLSQAGLPKAERARRASIVDPFHPLISETLVQYPTLSAVRLFAMAQARGYPGGAGLVIILLLMPIGWALYQATRIETSGYVFDATGPLTLKEVRANFIDQMDMPLEGARRECVFGEVEERARAAGDPETLEPTTVEFLPAERWNDADPFGRRILLAQVIVTKALIVCD